MRNTSGLIASLVLGLISVATNANAQVGMSAVPADEHPVLAGTPAPDGIGVVVAPARSAPTAAGAQTGSVGPIVDASVIHPLPVGTHIPANNVVQTVDGKPFDLNAAVAGKPTILIFYRGGWCPYCNAHLRELQTSVSSLKAMGYQLLAVSTDTPEALRKTLTDNKFDYQLLSDSKVEVAGKFGLKYKVTDDYLAHVAGMGTDLNAVNGGYLLTPAAYVLDKTGTVRFVYANNNYTVRISQDALLKAARDALNK
jgi:peroxiredoxin